MQHYFIIYREITFLAKITEIWIISKWSIGEKIQICCHNHNAKGNYPCMFLNSNSIQFRRTDRRPARQTDDLTDRRTDMMASGNTQSLKR